jgi:hypothetical protein
MADPESRGGRRTRSGPSLSGAKGKRGQNSKFVGSKARADALEVGLDLVDEDIPAKALSPSAYERTKKARMK